MKYADIKPLDANSTKGIGCLVYFSGCTLNCEGCHNKNIQDFNYGNEWTKEVEDYFIDKCKNPHVKVVGILGGEPFQQSYTQILNLFKRLKSEVCKPIWVWTGYTYNQLIMNDLSKHILSYIDVLIDGRFNEELKDIKLKYRGSSNQRIIDVQESLKQNKVVILQ